MKLGLTMAALVLAGAAASSGARASSDPAWIACTTPNNTPSVAIPNCDAFLRGGAGTPTDRATAFYYRGNALFAQQNYSGAIGEYTSAVRLNPSYAKAFNNMGFAYSKLGDYAHAIPNYSVAISLDPQYSVALMNRGNAQAQMGQYARAAEDYDRVIQLTPSDTTAYFNRGVAHYRSGALGKAIADYDVVLSRTPNDQDARNNRALAQQQLQRLTTPPAPSIQAAPSHPSTSYQTAQTRLSPAQIADCDRDIKQQQIASQSWSGSVQQVSGRLGQYQRDLFMGRCAGHPQAAAYIAGANRMLQQAGYSVAQAPQTGSSQFQSSSSGGSGSGGRQVVLNPATGQPCVTLVGQQRDQYGYYRLTLQNTCQRPFSTYAHIIPRNGGTPRTPVRGSGIVAAQGVATTSTLTCSDHDSDPCAGFSDWWAN